MHLNLHFQARPRTVDAPGWFVYFFRSEDIYHSLVVPEWVAMGGQICNDCSTCISSES